MAKDRRKMSQNEVAPPTEKKTAGKGEVNAGYTEPFLSNKYLEKNIKWAILQDCNNRQAGCFFRVHLLVVATPRNCVRIALVLPPLRRQFGGSSPIWV